MKKLISIILALALVLALAGCGGGGNGETPEGTVKTFCEGLKAYDFKKVAGTIKGGDPGDLDDAGANMPEGFMKYLKDWAGKLKYKIGEVKADGNTATVTLTLTYTDASELMAAAVKDTLQEAIKAAMSGDVSQEKMMSIMMECIDKAVKEHKTAEGTLTATFKLEKTADGWKITDIPPSVATAATFNIMGVFNNLIGM